MASAGVGEDAVHVHLFTCCWPKDNPLLIVLDVSARVDGILFYSVSTSRSTGIGSIFFQTILTRILIDLIKVTLPLIRDFDPKKSLTKI